MRGLGLSHTHILTSSVSIAVITARHHRRGKTLLRGQDGGRSSTKPPGSTNHGSPTMIPCCPTVAAPCKVASMGQQQKPLSATRGMEQTSSPRGCTPQQVPAQPGAAPRGRKLPREAETHLLKQRYRDRHKRSPNSHIYTPEDAPWSSRTPRGESAGGSPTRGTRSRCLRAVGTRVSPGLTSTCAGRSRGIGPRRCCRAGPAPAPPTPSAARKAEVTRG